MVAAIQLLFPDAHCPQLADEQIPALARGQDSLHEQRWWVSQQGPALQDLVTMHSMRTCLQLDAPRKVNRTVQLLNDLPLETEQPGTTGPCLLVTP